MTKRIAGLAIVAAAAASFVLPAAPATAAGECINMGTTPVECLLEMLAPAAICIPRGHTPPICLAPVNG